VIDVSASLLADALHDRYVVESELGRGGMAVVYLARDLKHERLVALKVLHPHLAATLGPERFLREIRLAAHLRHPHILPLYDSGRAGESFYYVMPYVEGESLRGRLTRTGRLPLEEALRVAREIAAALDYAHRHGIVHRDIKPENILLEEGHALVVDFGVARALGGPADQRLTGAGLAVGTAAYMSPEQTDGEIQVDGRSDLYSLACVLYEMLAGEPPFIGPSALAILARRLTEPPPRLDAVCPEIPAGIAEAVQRTLSLDPRDRFATAADFAEALVAVSQTGAQGRQPRQPLAGDASIAVLPFANLSADQENEYFSDGMTEELINALVKAPGLQVASRTSAFVFKKRDLDVKEIGKRLNVRTILEGSVRRAGDRLRITVQLINAMDGYHIWSETYERQMADVFAIQEDISRTIVDTLKLKLSAGAIAMGNPRTENMEAYHSYLKGRYVMNHLTSQDVRRGIELFERSAKVDPGYPLAYAALAESYHLLAVFGALPVTDAYPRAKAAAIEALQRDALNVDAHVVLACAAMCHDWDWPTAEREFRRAIELEPRHAKAHFWYAWYLTGTGRPVEAVAAMRRTVELDPLALYFYGYGASVLSLCARHDEAIEQCQKALEVDPTYSAAYEALGWTYLHKGMYADATAAFEQVRSQSPSARSLRLGLTQALMGNVEAGRRSAEEHEVELQPGSGPPGNTSYYVAAIWAALGNLDRAFEWLQRAFGQRLFALTYVKVDPLWSKLHSDPRFLVLLKRVGLDF
jgi:serine/threonine protein kinase/Tfp pilus assembly protein PilF